MAQTVHLKLQIDGNDIDGESTISSMDREGTIECSSFHHEVIVPSSRPGIVTRRGRQHKPVKIHKRIDKSTPLLIKAMCNKEPVTYAEFRFFRPSLGSSGAEEHFFTVLLENGSISSVGQVSEDSIMGGGNAPPMMEEVAFVYKDITWTYAVSGATYKDTP